MRRRTEAKQSDTLTRLDARHAQAAIADDPGTKQRRGLHIIERRGKWIDEVGVRDSVLGISTIDDITGENRSVAQILHAAPAELTGAIGLPKPRHADAGAVRQLAD